MPPQGCLSPSVEFKTIFHHKLKFKCITAPRLVYLFKRFTFDVTTKNANENNKVPLVLSLHSFRSNRKLLAANSLPQNLLELKFKKRKESVNFTTTNDETVGKVKK